MLAASTAIGVPIVFLPVLQGLDLRVRTHAGALARFYFDALLGLTAVRAHGAGRAVRREHESRLVDWAQASQRLLRWMVLVDGLQALSGVGLAGWILVRHASPVADAAGVLLIGYWALNLPLLGEQIAMLVNQYPTHANVLLRLLEPLGAMEDEERKTAVGGMAHEQPGNDGAADIAWENVTVHAAGHTILEEVNLHLPPGSHVAVVGASGAGKSSLVGLLLGWHRAAAGRVLVDGESLDAARLDSLRRHTAWVDPAIHLWNRTLLEILLYGNPDGGLERVGDALEQSDLYGLLERLPDRLQTALGEGGGLLSGGEGQRVRLGRGLLKSRPRLVILDEPFRGLDREKRRNLLSRTRQVWRDATLLCVTHDVHETLDFPRVVVIAGGRIVQDGVPSELVQQPLSQYRNLLEAEDAVRTGLWSSPIWRRLQMQAGRLVEGQAATERS